VVFRKDEDGQWRVWRDIDNGLMPDANAPAGSQD
jgi:ketosteroid isomerase-like protein